MDAAVSRAICGIVRWTASLRPCGAVQSDPGCPTISGSQHTYCSKGPVPVCFSVYEERCEPSNQLYQCTDYIILPWCQPCPG